MPTPMAIGALPFADEDGAGIAQAAEQRFCKPQVRGFDYLYRLQSFMGTEAKRCGA
jgi:hypothetical protein